MQQGNPEQHPPVKRMATFLPIIRGSHIGLGSETELAGVRTRDPVIKSHMLYLLSYQLGTIR